MNDAEKLPTLVGVVMADGTEYKLTAMGGGGGDLIKNTYREVVSLDRIVGGLENVRAILFTVPGSNATMRVELPEISSNYLITRFICDKQILRFIVNKPTKEESTMASIELGEIQEAFAHIVWDREPIASGELVKVCEKELNWKKPTTYTVLRKLCERGLLQNIDGVVTSVISREAFYSAKSEQFVQDTFAGSLPAFNPLRKRIPILALLSIAVICVVIGVNHLWKSPLQSENEIKVNIQLDLTEDIGLFLINYDVNGITGAGGISNANKSMINKDSHDIYWSFSKEQLGAPVETANVMLQFTIVTEYFDPNYDNIYPEEYMVPIEPISFQGKFGELYHVIVTGNKVNGYHAGVN